MHMFASDSVRGLTYSKDGKVLFDSNGGLLDHVPVTNMGRELTWREMRFEEIGQMHTPAFHDSVVDKGTMDGFDMEAFLDLCRKIRQTRSLSGIDLTDAPYHIKVAFEAFLEEIELEIVDEEQEEYEQDYDQTNQEQYEEYRFVEDHWPDYSAYPGYHDYDEYWQLRLIDEYDPDTLGFDLQHDVGRMAWLESNSDHGDLLRKTQRNSDEDQSWSKMTKAPKQFLRHGPANDFGVYPTSVFDEPSKYYDVNIENFSSYRRYLHAILGSNRLIAMEASGEAKKNSWPKVPVFSQDHDRPLFIRKLEFRKAKTAYRITMGLLYKEDARQHVVRLVDARLNEYAACDQVDEYEAIQEELWICVHQDVMIYHLIRDYDLYPMPELVRELEDWELSAWELDYYYWHLNDPFLKAHEDRKYGRTNYDALHLGREYGVQRGLSWDPCHGWDVYDLQLCYQEWLHALRVQDHVASLALAEALEERKEELDREDRRALVAYLRSVEEPPTWQFSVAGKGNYEFGSEILVTNRELRQWRRVQLVRGELEGVKMVNRHRGTDHQDDRARQPCDKGRETGRRRFYKPVDVLAKLSLDEELDTKELKQEMLEERLEREYREYELAADMAANALYSSEYLQYG